MSNETFALMCLFAFVGSIVGSVIGYLIGETIADWVYRNHKY